MKAEANVGEKAQIQVLRGLEDCGLKSNRLIGAVNIPIKMTFMGLTLIGTLNGR